NNWYNYFYFQICIFTLFATSLAVAHHEEHQVPHYHFKYGVHDPHTHDVKDQYEHRDHDHVKGGYVMKEADGTKRIVEYTSGPHSGFQAIVRRVGHAQHPAYYGKHGHGGVGGTSYVGVTHWGHGSGR
ncbi:cuticle protein 19-like, partial [Rhynchophorus ferrugineus]|uniref:cuticle protein 19-like n=1 Tax=Rhynchophorus ferrugineus TaxID=354439 RepID=UPI003FCC7B44